MDFNKNISEKVWIKLYDYLSGFTKIHTNNEEKSRRFVEAVFFCCKKWTSVEIIAERIG